MSKEIFFSISFSFKTFDLVFEFELLSCKSIHHTQDQGDFGKVTGEQGFKIFLQRIAGHNFAYKHLFSKSFAHSV